jgi:hypothetical protein
MNIRRFIVSLFAVALLSACAGGPPSDDTASLTFANLKPLTLNVSSVDVINKYNPPMKAPYIEHTFAEPPYKAAEALIRKQLVAGGGMNAVRVLINDASVVQEDADDSCGLVDGFKKMPVIRYRGEVAVRLEIYSPESPDVTLGYGNVVAKRSKSVVHNASIAEKEKAYFDLTEALMVDLDQGLKKVIREKLRITPDL